jgi:hypothetical protein
MLFRAWQTSAITPIGRQFRCAVCTLTHIAGTFRSGRMPAQSARSSITLHPPGDARKNAKRFGIAIHGNSRLRRPPGTRNGSPDLEKVRYPAGPSPGRQRDLPAWQGRAQRHGRTAAQARDRVSMNSASAPRSGITNWRRLSLSNAMRPSRASWLKPRLADSVDMPR